MQEPMEWHTTSMLPVYPCILPLRGEVVPQGTGNRFHRCTVQGSVIETPAGDSLLFQARGEPVPDAGMALPAVNEDDRDWRIRHYPENMGCGGA